MAKQGIHTAFLRSVGGDADDRNEGDGNDSFPHLHPPGGYEPQDHQQPDKGQHGEEDGDREHRIFFYFPRLPGWYHADTKKGGTHLLIINFFYIKSPKRTPLTHPTLTFRPLQ